MATPSKVVLSANVPITDKNGNPSPYFVRQLETLLDEKADIAVVADAAAATADAAAATADAAVPVGTVLAEILSEMAGDPNADRILFWDDSAGAFKFLTPGTNLTITDTTIDAAGGGGGGGSSIEVAVTKPIASSFTAINGGTLSDATYGPHLVRTVAGVGFANDNTAPGASAFTLTARLTPTYAKFTTGYAACIILRNNTNGRLLIFGDYQGGTNMLVQGWTSYTVFSSNIIAPFVCDCARYPWRRVTLASGVLDFQTSPDGDIWQSIGTTNVSSFLTATGGGTLDQVGFGGFSVNSTLCQSWTLV